MAYYDPPYPGERVQCICCQRSVLRGEHYAYLGGYYCSKECYGTLFETCDDCGQLNMSVPANQRLHNEHVCDECYRRRHGLVVVTLVWRTDERLEVNYHGR